MFRTDDRRYLLFPPLLSTRGRTTTGCPDHSIRQWIRLRHGLPESSYVLYLLATDKSEKPHSSSESSLLDRVRSYQADTSSKTTSYFISTSRALCSTNTLVSSVLVRRLHARKNLITVLTGRWQMRRPVKEPRP